MPTSADSQISRRGAVALAAALAATVATAAVAISGLQHWQHAAPPRPTQIAAVQPAAGAVHVSEEEQS